MERSLSPKNIPYMGRSLRLTCRLNHRSRKRKTTAVMALFADIKESRWEDGERRTSNPEEVRTSAIFPKLLDLNHEKGTALGAARPLVLWLAAPVSRRRGHFVIEEHLRSSRGRADALPWLQHGKS